MKHESIFPLVNCNCLYAMIYRLFNIINFNELHLKAVYKVLFMWQLLVLLLICHANCQDNQRIGVIEPASCISHAKVYLYNLQSQLGSHYEIYKDGQLDSTVFTERVIMFTGDSLMQILNWISSSEVQVLQVGLSSCFVPHHAIVFYNSENANVGSLLICFYCDAIRVSQSLIRHRLTKKVNHNMGEFSAKQMKLAKVHLHKLQTIIEGIGLPVFDSPVEYESWMMSQLKM